MHLLRFPLRQGLAAFLTVLLLGTLATAQDQKSKLPTDPDVVTGRLDNGLVYYIRNNHKPANKVELRLAVKAGSILETDAQQGLAHFLEHMNFNGTKNFQKNELVSYLQSIGVQFGADLNAYTGFDQTVYILPIPTDKPGNLEKGFQIIEDWAHSALLTDKDIDEERGVVLEESRLGKGANDRMLRKYFPRYAAGSLYAERLPIGKDDILKTFKYETIRSFYTDWYRPDLQAVIVVGDIEVATAKKMIIDHFGGLKNPANEKKRTYVDVAPRTASEAMVVTDKEATNSILQIAFPYKKEHDFATIGDYKYMLTKQLALGMLNHRLSDLSQGSNPPFPYSSVFFNDMIHGYESFGLFALYPSDGLEKAINAATGELVKAEKFGFNESELELVKKEELSNFEKAFNERKTTESKVYVEEYIRAFLDNEPYPGVANEYEYRKTMLPAIKLEDVNALIKEWVATKNTFTLITAPDKKDVQLPTEKELLEMTQKGFAQNVSKSEEKQVATTLMTSKPTAGKVVAETKEKGFEATTYTLSNGVKVTIKPTDFKTDEVLMSGLKKGGTNSYGLADRSNSIFATEIVSAMGVGEFSPSDLEKVMAGKTVEVSVQMDEIFNAVSASSSVKDMESMLQLTHLYITSPRKDEGLFKAFKEKQSAMMQYVGSNPKYAFYDTTVKVLYNNNPRAQMVFPKPADFERINLERSLQIYKDEFSSADGYHFFLAGNVDAKTAIPMLETYLGSLPVAHKPTRFVDDGVRPLRGKKDFVLRRGKEKQSLIWAVYGGEIPYSEDLALRTQALAEVLNIKVIEEMREKMGAIYGGGFSGSVARDPYSRYSIQLQLPCGPENVDKLLLATNEEIKKLKEAGPTEKDVEKVKSQWREKHVTNVKENSYWNEQMKQVLFWGKDIDRVVNFESYLMKLKPQTIKETANQLLAGDNKFVAILNPEE